jgi:hypothetical protein
VNWDGDLAELAFCVACNKKDVPALPQMSSPEY